MGKISKGQEFLNSYEDEDHQTIYDLIKENQNQSAKDVAKKLLQESNIKITWQDADSEIEET